MASGKKHYLSALFEERKLVYERIGNYIITISENIHTCSTKMASVMSRVSTTILRFATSEDLIFIPSIVERARNNLDALHSISTRIQHKTIRYMCKFLRVQLRSQQAFDTFGTVRIKYNEGDVKQFNAALNLFDESVKEYYAAVNNFEAETLGEVELIEAEFNTFNAEFGNFNLEFDNMKESVIYTT